MRPTIDDQVAGARRLLSSLIDADELPAGARETLINARRLLDQVGRSWAALPDFYADDNAALTALLVRLRAVLPDAAAARITETLAAPAPPLTDLNATAEYNAGLRKLLSTALGELSCEPDGDCARAEIGVYLRHRVDTDPA